ncbi:hypothetical protein AVEN_221518-1 [Araneus ventricosus]|uniref:Uncharacterized protein n=1 Tax=Araneus ventricosus TaxID=182803 RepID=A0A4Y2U5U5_ARAVE|nr:hypothetical protein AVEN_221518-1 [Araneus ventricosus]
MRDGGEQRLLSRDDAMREKSFCTSCLRSFLDSTKDSSGATLPLKEAKWAPRSHPYYLTQSQCLFQRDMERCSAINMMPALDHKPLRHNGHFADIGGQEVPCSLHMNIRRESVFRLNQDSSGRERSPIDPYFNLYALCTILNGLSCS